MRIAILIAIPALIVIVLELVLNLLTPQQAIWLDLDHPPQPDRVLIVGNSMFKTGLDLQRFRTKTNQNIDFNYFDGYYTNFWYIIAKNVLTKSPQKPKVLIWGFRPTYAVLPAFRQRQAGYIERYSLKKESEYEAITANAPLPWKENIDRLLNRLYLYAERDDARAAVLDTSKRFAVRILSATDSRYRDESSRDMLNTSPVGDLLLAAVTENQVRMSEELVADVAGTQDSRFITGERSRFDDSFVPRIANMISEAGIPQMVVIFKPVSELQGKTPDDVIQFKTDAVRSLGSDGIPVVDVFDGLTLDLDDYGSGDHYNESGRQKVTDYIATAYLREFGHGSSENRTEIE